jgi:hypothetical protein
VSKHSRFLLIILTTLILSGCGITAGSLRGDPGYADLDYPGWREVDKEFGLSLGRLPLRLAAWAVDEGDDPETAALLRGLKGMRIRIYEVQGDEQRVFDRIDESRRRLEKDGWDKLVTVNDGDQNVLVMIKTNNAKISGMTVLTADRDEAVFVNMIGDIQPEFFNEIMNSVDADVDLPDIEIAESPNSDDV